MGATINTREFIGDGLAGIVEKEFNKCGERVLQCNRADAWDLVGTPSDTPSHAGARCVWSEWLMFSKTVLPTLPEGKAKAKRNGNLMANRAARWATTERASL
jgi:hypothetical protein